MKKVYRRLRLALSIFCIAVAVILLSYLAFVSFYRGKFFPGVKVAGVSVGGQNTGVVRKSLTDEFKKRSASTLALHYQDQTFSLSLENVSLEANLDDSVNKAILAGRSGNVLTDLETQFKLLLVGDNFIPELKYKNKSQLLSQISAVNQQIKKDAVPAQIVFGDTITITPSQNGSELDSQKLLILIESYLVQNSAAPQNIPIKPIEPALSTAKAEKYKKALVRVKNNPIKLTFTDNTWTIDQATLYSLLDFNNTKPELLSYDDGSQNFSIEGISIGPLNLTDEALLLDNNLLNAYLKNIAKKIDQPLKEAKFAFDENTIRVTEFEPGQQGQQLNLTQTSALISKALADETISDIVLPVETIYPKNSIDEVNKYGIKELLGVGTSSFIDSIPNRVFNIGLAASKINGILVPPGETFSFDVYLGEVNAATGFKQAYVIKEGKTVLDDGGGVCQVSTTLFRAILNAGLPVVERTAHAYRVGFYEQGGSPPGLDATVYPPFVDLKFKNDTGSYILIQNYMTGTTLTYKIYGTSDGRITTLSKPNILSQTAPPPELRQDDPTLPKGVEQETEHSIWGMSVQFRRTVVRGSETLIDEFIRSNFRPWQRVIKVGTKQ